MKNVRSYQKVCSVFEFRQQQNRNNEKCERFIIVVEYLHRYNYAHTNEHGDTEKLFKTYTDF